MQIRSDFRESLTMQHRKSHLVYRTFSNVRYGINVHFDLGRCAAKEMQPSISHKAILLLTPKHTYVRRACYGKPIWKERRPSNIVSCIPRCRISLWGRRCSRSVHVGRSTWVISFQHKNEQCGCQILHNLGNGAREQAPAISIHHCNRCGSHSSQQTPYSRSVYFVTNWRYIMFSMSRQSILAQFHMFYEV